MDARRYQPLAVGLSVFGPLPPLEARLVAGKCHPQQYIATGALVFVEGTFENHVPRCSRVVM